MKRKLQKALARTDGFLEENAGLIERRLDAALRKLENRIIALMERIERKADGTFKGPKWTLKQAQAVHAQLAQVFDETYGAANRTYARKLGRIPTFIRDNFSDLDVPVAFSKVDKELLTVLQGRTVQGLEALGQQTHERIANSVYTAITSGQSLNELSTEIAGAVRGHKDVRGSSLAIYSKTYAHDSFMETFATLNKTKSLEAGFTKFMYAGDIIRDTRKFCMHRAGKVYTVEEIDSWNGMDWAGKKSGNVWVTRGGWYCRHHFQPVREEWL